MSVPSRRRPPPAGPRRRPPLGRSEHSVGAAVAACRRRRAYGCLPVHRPAYTHLGTPNDELELFEARPERVVYRAYSRPSNRTEAIQLAAEVEARLVADLNRRPSAGRGRWQPARSARSCPATLCYSTCAEFRSAIILLDRSRSRAGRGSSSTSSSTAEAPRKGREKEAPHARSSRSCSAARRAAAPTARSDELVRRGDARASSLRREPMIASSGADAKARALSPSMAVPRSCFIERACAARALDSGRRSSPRR